VRIRNHQVSLRTVQLEDAAFIVKLRTDTKNARFISETSNEVDDQTEWLKRYKKRENDKEEFYFIGNTMNGVPFGTTRLYNLNGKTFTNGSWVVLHDTNPKFSIMIDLLVRSYAFNDLGFETCFFDVRKQNKKVIKYHSRLGAKFEYSTELDNYYTIKKNDFFVALKKMIGLGYLHEEDLQYTVSQ
jgi:RimJ/RimL family protein N-acetyltransferase